MAVKLNLSKSKEVRGNAITHLSSSPSLNSPFTLHNSLSTFCFAKQQITALMKATYTQKSQLEHIPCHQTH